MTVVSLLKRILRDTQAATAVEYGLIVSLIVIAMIGALQGVASETVSMWDEVSAEVSEASNH